MKSFSNFLIIALAVLAALPAAALANPGFDLVIVRGDIPVDMLVAQAYTTEAGIPLATVTNNFIIDELQDELYGYHAQGFDELLIIGGTGAIPASIEKNLADMGYLVTRIWDWNRYGTSARVAMTLWEKSETIVVSQGNAGELMLAARTAVEYNSPLLLTEGDKLSEETKTAIEALGATRIILIGDASKEVKDELAKLGGLQQTMVRPVKREEPGSKTFFIIGAVIGGLVIFLVSSLWGAAMFRKKVPSFLQGVFETDEQKILKLLENGQIKQEDLPKLTGFSRPKITRIVSELLKKKSVSREKRGKTYILKKL